MSRCELVEMEDLVGRGQAGNLITQEAGKLAQEQVQILNQTPLLNTLHLSKYYETSAGAVRALEDVNLSIRRGEFLGVVGKSGAGKSTLANMLTGIDRPTDGQVIIDGLDLHQLPQNQLDRWRGKNIGIVFQFFQLLPSLTLVENITLAMDFCQTYPLKDREARALALLDRVGLVDHANKVPSKISGGQQQRVAIARALANDPMVLVADEPTGNLDSKTAEGIFNLFSSLVEDGKTIVLVSHDQHVKHWATHSIELVDGCIQIEGDRGVER